MPDFIPASDALSETRQWVREHPDEMAAIERNIDKFARPWVRLCAQVRLIELAFRAPTRPEPLSWETSYRLRVGVWPYTLNRSGRA